MKSEKNKEIVVFEEAIERLKEIYPGLIVKRSNCHAPLQKYTIALSNGKYLYLPVWRISLNELLYLRKFSRALRRMLRSQILKRIKLTDVWAD